MENQNTMPKTTQTKTSSSSEVQQPLHNHELHKPVTPNHLKLPKPFKYPERYTSPTDMMMSPITKGLLARNKKSGSVLPPGLGDAKYQPKVPDMCLQDVSPIQKKLPMMIDEKINST